MKAAIHQWLKTRLSFARRAHSTRRKAHTAASRRVTPEAVFSVQTTVRHTDLARFGMLKVRVYRFQKYAVTVDGKIRSTRMATREQIDRIGAEVIPGTEVDIDASLLNEDGWTERNFVSPL